MLVNFHYCGLIAASVAVVWRTKDRDHVSVLTPIISLHHQLMCSRYQRQAVVVVEGLRNVLAECVACTPWTDAPSTSVVWIAPEQVTHWTLMRHLLNTVQTSDVIKSVNARAKAPVEAEYLVID